MQTHTFLFIDMGLLNNCPTGCSQLVKILITLEPYRIAGSNLAYLFLLIVFIHPCMQGPGITLAGLCILVKMLITVEPHSILKQ